MKIENKFKMNQVPIKLMNYIFKISTVVFMLKLIKLIKKKRFEYKISQDIAIINKKCKG